MLYSKLICGPERKQNVSSSVVEIFSTYIYPALLVLFFFGLTIFVHELGHFLVAKRRGLVIERFSVGFGPKIFGWEREGIEYRVSWLPFGGYVALPQMAPMEAIEGKSEKPAQQIPPAPPLSKVLVAVAGPIMNLLFAFLIACVLWQVGMPSANNSTVVGWVDPGSSEETVGIHPGDRIVRVDGKDVKKWHEVLAAVATSLEPTIKIEVEREHKQLEFTVETTFQKDFGIKTTGLYPPGRPIAMSIRRGSPAERAGIKPKDEFLAVEGVPVNGRIQLIELVSKRADKPTQLKVLRDGQVLMLTVVPEYDEKAKAGRMQVVLGEQVVKPGPNPFEQFGDVLGMLGTSIYAIAHHEKTGVGMRSFSGPLGIMGGWWAEFASGGMRRGLSVAVMLNISLAVFNLLPIPVLDGGHILFAAIEGIRRKPVSPRFAYVTSTAFAAILITFMLYISVLDVQKFLPARSPRNPTPQTNEPAIETNHP